MSRSPSKMFRIYFRGALRSCNFDCTYCPMKKQPATASQVAADERGLNRLVGWAARQPPRSLGVCFTPWGEVLHQAPYRDAIVSLSHLEAVVRVVAQTNLSHPVAWISMANPRPAALWCTYHPRQMERDIFLTHCAALDQLGIRYSVGMVGIKEHFGEIALLRRLLNRSVYLWVNAFRRGAGYYSDRDLAWLEAIDPHFRLNVDHYPSRGGACEAGQNALVVDEVGGVRRCHLVHEHLGNLYEAPSGSLLTERRCPRERCGCYLGLVNIPDLEMASIYGDGVLERIPKIPWNAGLSVPDELAPAGR